MTFSCLHQPYQHPDAWFFLREIKYKMNPTRVINLGDEIDNHALSYHESDPDLPSAGDELDKAIICNQTLLNIFPEQDIMTSNHTSLPKRKAKSAGMPRAWIKSYNEVLHVPDTWKWYNFLIVTLPNGQKVRFQHQSGANAMGNAKAVGMSYVQGHHHSRFECFYFTDHDNMPMFGMTVGCLIDDVQLAFLYNKTTAKRPKLGAGMIINSKPLMIPMVLDKHGRWIGRLV